MGNTTDGDQEHPKSSGGAGGLRTSLPAGRDRSPQIDLSRYAVSGTRRRDCPKLCGGRPTLCVGMTKSKERHVYEDQH